MTASCCPITAARLASIAASQSLKKASGSSATPSSDSNSYTTTLRMPVPISESDRPADPDRIRVVDAFRTLEAGSEVVQHLEESLAASFAQRFPDPAGKTIRRILEGRFD